MIDPRVGIWVRAAIPGIGSRLSGPPTRQSPDGSGAARPEVHVPMSQPPADELDRRPLVPARIEPGTVESSQVEAGIIVPGQNGDRRVGLIAKAQSHWAAALTDLGGRNTLLYFKDRRSGTLDLADADPDAFQHFTESGSIRLSRLFRDVDARADAIRRIGVIYRKARELLEERGIRAGYLATGMARWDELFLQPAAPVLLRGLTITPTRARHDDFDLALDDDSEINPVLLHKLASVFGADTERLAHEPGERLYQQLSDAALAAEVPGFEI